MNRTKGNIIPQAAVATVALFELVTMPWYCLDCRQRFEGPANRAPSEGCPRCHGQSIFDINVTAPGPKKVIAASN
jgi:hypothetical protein